ncbi:MAG: protoporphyrinogen oxidase [Proteobacteria bacterium]|nr:protoporphyrinogen oxidase [Pseudomonadota bacterium]
MNDSYQTIIIGGGLSGLVVAHKLKLHNPGHRFAILEKGERTGGVIATHSDQGYISERGPHGFLDNCEESRQILTETGLHLESVKAPLIDFVRYVRLNNKLNLIPQTPGKILLAPLIPWQAKLRVLAELWQPFLEGEPTVAKWVDHRFGPALLPYLDAVYTGTYAGDFDRLTVDSVMPGLRALEKKYGSVLRGLLVSLMDKRKSGADKTPLKMPAMTSFAKGMQRLPEKLAEHLAAEHELFLNTTVTGVHPLQNGWLVESSRGHCRSKNVVFAVPVNSALQLLAKLDPNIPETSIPSSWIATVVFGFKESVKLPPGFGFLAPEKEQRFTLGALFTSNMFPGRAPAGHIVFETLIGGRRHPERLELNDGTLASMAFEDVREILDLPRQPAYTKVLHTVGGIPQLERNYPRLLAWREKFLDARRGLHICGFGWDGIGLNDMMKHATRVSESILNDTGTPRPGAELKGIYF